MNTGWKIIEMAFENIVIAKSIVFSVLLLEY